MCKCFQKHSSWNLCAHLDSHRPLTTTSPANKYWGVDQSIRYGNSVRILDETAGVIDTGTSLILIATGKLLCDSDSLPMGVLGYKPKPM